MASHMWADYHIHTSLCGHADGDAREYVERAIKVGLIEIGFADHLPLSQYDLPGYAMRRADVDQYVSTVLSLAQEYAEDIRILLGGEVDFFETSVERDAELLAEYPFDYAIGSVHFVQDGFSYDHPDASTEMTRRGVDGVYVASYELVAKAARTGLFRIVGHLDLAKKHGQRPVDGVAVGAAATTALEAIANAGVALELNTAGWRKPIGEAYPAPDLLAQAAGLGIPLVLGSDAHRPDDVGSEFARAASLARSCGYTGALRLSSDTVELWEP
ncbi:MAG: histidinol-phosphatase HisJ [Thermoleophilia bacterium]